MDSSVDMPSSRSYAGFAKSKAISCGVTVSRLKSGKLVLSAHSGDIRVLFDVTEDECRRLAFELRDMLGGEHIPVGEVAPVGSENPS